MDAIKMNSLSAVEQLEVLTELAKDMGYEVRQEALGGTGGGRCEVAGKKLLIIDLQVGTMDQLESVSKALASDPQLALYVMTKDQEQSLRRAA